MRIENRLSYPDKDIRDKINERLKSEGKTTRCGISVTGLYYVEVLIKED